MRSKFSRLKKILNSLERVKELPIEQDAFSQAAGQRSSSVFSVKGIHG